MRGYVHFECLEIVVLSLLELGVRYDRGEIAIGHSICSVT